MDGIKHYLIDMDGVILRGSALIPGAAEFVQRLRAQEIPFLILTNNSRYIPRDLQVRLSYLGLEVPARSDLHLRVGDRAVPARAATGWAGIRHWGIRADNGIA